MTFTRGSLSSDGDPHKECGKMLYMGSCGFLVRDDKEIETLASMLEGLFYTEVVLEDETFGQSYILFETWNGRIG